MIFDLRALKKSGKNSQAFYFELVPESEIVSLPSVEFVTPLRVCGTVSLTGENSAFVEGEASFTLGGNCTRCLAETQKDYLFGFAEECDGEEENPYPVVNDKIDLKKIAFDTVITNAPMVFLCKDDCKGLCSGCGVNLNNEQCKCK